MKKKEKVIKKFRKCNISIVTSVFCSVIWMKNDSPSVEPFEGVSLLTMTWIKTF